MNTNDISIDIFRILEERNIDYEIDDMTWYDGIDDVYIINIGNTKVKILQHVEKTANGEYLYYNHKLLFPYTDKNNICGYDNILKIIQENIF